MDRVSRFKSALGNISGKPKVDDQSVDNNLVPESPKLVHPLVDNLMSLGVDDGSTDEIFSQLNSLYSEQLEAINDRLEMDRRAAELNGMSFQDWLNDPMVVTPLTDTGLSMLINKYLYDSVPVESGGIGEIIGSEVVDQVDVVNQVVTDSALRATHTLFSATELLVIDDQRLGRELVLKQFIDHTFQYLGVNNLHLSFFGGSLDGYIPSGYRIVEMGNQQFISIAYAPANLDQISLLLNDIKSGMRDNCYVTSLVRLVGNGGYTLLYSLRDLETVRTHFPEYSFGLIDDTGNVSDLRLVVELS